MNILPQNIQKLISLLEQLPGFGPKSAARIALFLLKSPENYLKNLGGIIFDLKKNIVFCGICHNIASNDPCNICEDTARNRSQICVVEDVLDVLAFENGAEYNGLYHVLGGSISPVNGVSAEDLTIGELISRIKTSKDLKEVIIATNPDIEGEATSMYIKELILKLGLKDVTVSRLARGLPTGADLEYADKITLKRAFEGRTKF